MKKRFLFKDGLMIEANASLLESLEPWALRGRGVFETIKVSNGKIIFLDQHLARLTKSLKKLEIKCPLSKEELRKVSYQSLKKNRMKNARMRLTVWQDNLRTKTSIVAFPQKEVSQRRYESGFKARVVPLRYNENSKEAGLKSIKYRTFLKAYSEAKRRGGDEAILLNRKNEVAEGSRTNIFFLKNGILYTPALKSGCLNGITRQNVLNLARSLKIKCVQASVNLDDLKSAQEAFLTNSLLGIMPLTSIDGQRIATGKAGVITRRLSRKLQAKMRTARH